MTLVPFADRPVVELRGLNRGSTHGTPAEG